VPSATKISGPTAARSAWRCDTEFAAATDRRPGRARYFPAPRRARTALHNCCMSRTWRPETGISPCAYGYGPDARFRKPRRGSSQCRGRIPNMANIAGRSAVTVNRHLSQHLSDRRRPTSGPLRYRAVWRVPRTTNAAVHPQDCTQRHRSSIPSMTASQSELIHACLDSIDRRRTTVLKIAEQIAALRNQRRQRCRQARPHRNSPCSPRIAGQRPGRDRNMDSSASWTTSCSPCWC